MEPGEVACKVKVKDMARHLVTALNFTPEGPVSPVKTLPVSVTEDISGVIDIEDPFSTEFEENIEGALEGGDPPFDEITMDQSNKVNNIVNNHTQSHKLSGKKPPPPPPKPSGTMGSAFQEAQISNHGTLNVEYEDQPSELYLPSTEPQEEEEWPAPPECLDEFTQDTVPAGPEPPEVQPQNHHPVLSSFAAGQLRFKRELRESDSWSIVCEQGSKMSIMDDVFDDEIVPENGSVPEPPTRNMHADLTRTRSDVIHSRRHVGYENVDLSNMQRPHSELFRSRSTAAGQYENVAMPLGRPLSLHQPDTSPSHENGNNGSSKRSESRYENVVLPFELVSQDKESSQTVSSDNSRNSSALDSIDSSPGHIQLTFTASTPQNNDDSVFGEDFVDTKQIDHDDKDDLENLENLSDDDSYFTDSDFDDDGGDMQDFGDDPNSFRISESEEKDFLKGAMFEGERSTEQILDRLLEAERIYVDRLHFICRVVLVNLRVLTRLPGVNCPSPDVQKQIFANIEVIFHFHTANLLPALTDLTSPRTEDGLCIGKTLAALVPYFKLYIEYVTVHKQAMTAYDHCLQRNGAFSALVHEVEKLQECGHTTVKNLLQDIANQVPKYQAAFKEYLDKLPADSEDKASLEDVVESLTKTCYELDRAMGKDDRMKTLKDVQSRLDITYSIIKATRELQREAKIHTIHPQTGHLLDRYIFFFNDMLLLCGPKLITGKHEIRFNLSFDGLQVHEGDNLLTPHTFYIQSKTKALEFACSSEEEKVSWIKAIKDALEEDNKWTFSGHVIAKTRTTSQADDIGKVKPEVLTATGVQSCKLCSSSMGTLRRKYHCQACGQVICSKCSKLKAPLDYDNRKLGKVCDECYVIIRNRELANGGLDYKLISQNVRPRDPCRISGLLQFSANKGRSWKKRWFLVHDSGIMYCFKDHNASTVSTFLPIKRFSVASTVKGDPVHKSTVFKLYNLRRTYYLMADTADLVKQWVDIIGHFCDSCA